MNRKIAAVAAAVALVAGGLIWASPAMADDVAPPDGAVVQPEVAVDPPADPVTAPEVTTEGYGHPSTPPCPDPGQWGKGYHPPKECLIEVTPSIEWTPPTCDEPGSITFGSGDGVDWGAVLNDDNSTTYTATAHEGYNFPKGAQTQWTVPSLKQLPEDSDECYTPPTEVTPPAPEFVDPCGVNNASWKYEETKGVVWTTDQVGNFFTISAAPADGFAFPKDAVTVWKMKDSNVLCVTAVPTQFSADPTPPTCDTDGALPNLEGEVAEIVVGHVDLHFDRAYDGPGTYTLTADALDGYTFDDGTTHKEREITVGGATGFQSTNPEAPCFLAAPLTTTLATPTIDDQCGTENDFANLPASTETVFYGWADFDDPSNFDVLATVAEGYSVTGNTTGWVNNENGTWTYAWSPQFTDEPCSTPTPTPTPASTPPVPQTLASTGGGDTSPLIPISAGLGSALGVVLILMGRFRRRA